MGFIMYNLSIKVAYWFFVAFVLSSCDENWQCLGLDNDNNRGLLSLNKVTIMLSSLQPDEHVAVLCWQFQHSNDCHLHPWLHISHQNEHAPLHILKVSFQINQSFAPLLCFLAWEEYMAASLEVSVWNINFDTLNGSSVQVTGSSESSIKVVPKCLFSSLSPLNYLPKMIASVIPQAPLPPPQKNSTWTCTKPWTCIKSLFSVLSMLPNTLQKTALPKDYETRQNFPWWRVTVFSGRLVFITYSFISRLSKRV